MDWHVISRDNKRASHVTGFFFGPTAPRSFFKKKTNRNLKVKIVNLCLHPTLGTKPTRIY